METKLQANPSVVPSESASAVASDSALPNVSGTPLVSVIIPVRNAKDYIQDAIDSVFSQDYPALEIVLIDDGSDDFDYAALSQQDDRIRVTRLEGRGVSHARNTGMKLARGDYFAFLDADDVWFPGKLKSQIRYLERNPHVGIVFGEFVSWRSDATGQFEPAKHLVSDCSQLTQADPARSGWLYSRLLLGLLVGMNTAVIRRDIYARLGGFNETMRIGEDYDFWLRASHVAEMHSLAGPVALYRIHSASAMHRLHTDNHLALLLESARARWGLSTANGDTLSRQAFRARLADAHFNHGYTHFWRGDPVIAMRSFGKALAGGARPARSLAYCVISSLKATKDFALQKAGSPPQVASKPPLANLANSTVNSTVMPLPGTRPVENDGSSNSTPIVRVNSQRMNPVTPLWARMMSATLCGALTGNTEHPLTIFTFHKVPDETAEGASSELTLQQFKKLIHIVQTYFTIVPLEEGIARLQKNALPRFSAAITFDDGYPNWLTGVIPILEYDSIPATFFVSTCQLEGNALWFERLYKILGSIDNDSTRLADPFEQNGLLLNRAGPTKRDDVLKMVKYLPIVQRDAVIASCEQALGLKNEFRLFDEQDLKTLRAKGFTIGAHTVNHPILACCSDTEARTEIVRSKEMLEDILREPVTLFSYPNGVPGRDIKPAHIRMVQQAGFHGAVTTALGAAAPQTSIFQLPRFDPWARTPRRLLIQYLMTLKRPFPVIKEGIDMP